MQERALFADAFLTQPFIFRRLFNEVAQAGREFGHDPRGYVSTVVKGDGLGGRRRRMLLMYGMSIAILVLVTFWILIMFAYWWAHRASAANKEELTLVAHIANPDDFKPQDVDMPKANKKAGGGGGGGRNQPTPPSQGQLPKFSLTPPIMAPTTRPTLTPPVLPVMETVQVDPRLQKPRDDLAVTGLPTGVPGPPSDGPGSGNGIGTGKGGGVGSGDGTGVGPGRGMNTGGGDPSLGGGTGAAATSVDMKPQMLNKPRPNYTEEARKNKIQGVVLAQLLIGADGSVKQVRIRRGLADGLNEEAIRAAYQIRFKPAMKGGQPVSYWVGIEIEFNLR